MVLAIAYVPCASTEYHSIGDLHDLALDGTSPEVVGEVRRQGRSRDLIARRSSIAA